MQDWIKKLDDFLTLGDFEVLKTKGIISHTQALKKANEEYDKYKVIAINEKSRVESDFEDAIQFIENKNDE